ncbi:FimV/HubP family polar landmark protein [Niveibacterium sp. SC-1]|uniref:FimV/HubP family polar landmark protein n=1 Tax=Niveibacterium sp. SC-1 TaxID=3135646 RepID=UPI00311DA897
MKTSFRASLIAAAIAALPFAADAAGLGKLNVFSALGQPLRAEVDVSGSAEELDSINARIASIDAFRRANIDYAPHLSSLRLTLERRGAGAVVKIASDKPINEPFLDFLLEVNWAGGRLIREYTFLLDPAAEAAPKVASEAGQPVVKSLESQPTTPRGRRGRASASQSTAATPAAASEKPAKAPAKAEAAPAASTEGGDYTVKSGDTLTSIASANRPADASVEQMLAALYNANRTAFPNGNINRLRVGQELKVPDANTARSTTPAEARRTLAELKENFESYRQKAGAIVAQSPAKDSAAQQSASGKVTPKAEEPAKQAETKDQLKISKTQVAKDGSGAASAGRVQALEEDLATREKALQEANSRVAELEKNVKDLQKLLELKSQNLAKLQSEKTAAPAAAASPAAETKPVEKAPEPAPAAVVVEQSAPVAPTAQQSAASVTEPVAEASAPTPVAAAEQSKPVAKPAPAPEPAPQEESFLSGLFGNSAVLAGLGGVAVLLLGLVAYRRRQGKGPGPDTTALSATQTGGESVIGPAGGQTVDTGSSVLPTDFSQSGLTSIDADEGVDPVAEADVYMAYGRDAQAEEILLDALKSDPSRTAIHVKLLEIYSQRKSLKQFENIATDLYTQTGGSGADWFKAADLGSKLDPDNPLYRTDSQRATAPQPEPAMIDELSFVEPEVEEAPSFTASSPLEFQVEPEPEPVAPVKPVMAEPVAFGANPATAMQATWTMPGEIGQAARADIEQAIEEHDAKLDDSGLDFNLDLDVTPAPLAPADAEVTRVIAPPAKPAELDLDELPPLELEGHDLAIDEAKLSATNLGASSTEAPLTMDLDMGSPAPALAHEPVVVDDEDLGVSSSLGTKSESFVDLEKTNFESSLLDFDFNEERAPAAPAADRSIDLSGIDLELPQHAAAPQSQVDTHPEPQLLDEEVNVNEEVTTKLELARVYEEMRDFEGARELLEEVLADGSAGQKREAEAILARLA